MSDSLPEADGVDAQIGQLFDSVSDLTDRGCYASVCRLYGEIRRLSKMEERIVPYLISSFHLADKSSNILQPVQAKDLIVELIALVESEEAARHIQPNFPEAEYAAQVAWMATCVYDKLADTTAMIEGYNSPGMHESLQEGLQVCRRAGKLECIKCFREYAVDVYRAADDLEMARHNVRIVASNQGPQTVRGDRQWVGTHKESRLALLTGDLEDAERVARTAIDLTPTYHTQITARSEGSLMLETILLLAGRREELGPVSIGDRTCAVFPEVETPPVGEFPDLDLEFAMRDALLACCQGEAARAIEILTPFDRLLQERRYFDRWQEVRLRITAAAYLAGDVRKAEAFAKGLEARAADAQDWLTLRRLKCLRERPFPISPAALPMPLTTGRFAAEPSQRTVVVPENVPVASETPEPAEAPAPVPETPLAALLAELQSRFQEADSEAAVHELLDTILARSPDDVIAGRDAAHFLRLAEMLSIDSRRAEDTWTWAQALAGRFPSHPSVLNTLALLAATLQGLPDSPLAGQITFQQVDEWLKRSIQLDVNDWGNFARAGEFYLQTGNLAEAERCFARASRLNRAHPYLAQRLASVYSHTDRPRDALAVLDMCLREGTVEPPLLFEAAMLAQRLERPQAVVTYLDKYEELQPDEPWVHYYRALAFLDLNRPDEAAQALDVEETRSPDRPLPIAILRACVAHAQGDLPTCRVQAEAVLATPLHDIDYLTSEGLAQLFGRLWKVVSQASAAELLERLENLLLSTGLMPDEAFERHRDPEEKRDGIQYFVCQVRQPLDARWRESPGRLSGQEDWTEYVAHWGVLASDEANAEQRVLQWQSRCAPLPAEVIGCHPQPGLYHDSPGIVWQSPHFPEEKDDEASSS